MSRVPIHDHSNIHQGGKIHAATGITGVDLTGPTSGGGGGSSGGGGSTPSTIWVPIMVEDGASGLWYVLVTGDGDAVMTEIAA